LYLPLSANDRTIQSDSQTPMILLHPCAHLDLIWLHNQDPESGCYHSHHDRCLRLGIHLAAFGGLNGPSKFKLIKQLNATFKFDSRFVKMLCGDFKSLLACVKNSVEWFMAISSFTACKLSLLDFSSTTVHITSWRIFTACCAVWRDSKLSLSGSWLGG
jgi:hypothetical protein